jgi:hypothetical protein
MQPVREVPQNGEPPTPRKDIAQSDENIGSQPGQSKPKAVGQHRMQKRGLMEAARHGIKVGTSAALHAARVAYEQGRVKQTSDQEKPLPSQSGPSQHNTSTTQQITGLANAQHGGIQPYLSQAPQLSLSFESPDTSRNQDYTRFPPAQTHPLDRGFGSPYLDDGSVGVAMPQNTLSHDLQTHKGETFLNDEESTKGHNESVSPYVPLYSTLGGLTTRS